MQARPIIIVFYQNLRFHDQPLLKAAVQTGRPLIPVFIQDPTLLAQLGRASRWWLYQALIHFEQAWRERFSLPLILRTGDTLSVLQSLVVETHATAIYLGQRYTAIEKAIDETLIQFCQAKGIALYRENTHLLTDPSKIYTQQGKVFQVFTPFWKHCLATLSSPTVTEQAITGPLVRYEKPLESETLASWTWGYDQAKWGKRLAATWIATEEQALRQFDCFLNNSLPAYDKQRDQVAPISTSRLSPYLRWGQLSVRHVASTLLRLRASNPAMMPAIDRFLSELGWREFSYYLLTHYPAIASKPLQSQFDFFKWSRDTAAFIAWSKGQTGYPIVDAGMQQLWLEGWIPNRIRMVVASFLVKDLFIPWQDGLAWFNDTLVDADPANNANSWQWVAGCGADAAPYFRVFNPTKQSETFDPEGRYIQQYIPSLRQVPLPYIHRPRTLPASLQQQYGLQMGKDYPLPLVDHDQQRKQALAYWHDLKRQSS